MTDKKSNISAELPPLAGEAAAPVKKAATRKAPTPKIVVPESVTSATARVRGEAARLTGEATGRAKDYATQGKERASGALDDVARLVGDAANQVDDRLGEQYGRYARVASDAIARLATSLREKDVDQLVGDARDLVRKSPAIAIGAAAAIGFVVARLVKAGVDPVSPADPANDTAA